MEPPKYSQTYNLILEEFIITVSIISTVILFFLSHLQCGSLEYLKSKIYFASPFKWCVVLFLYISWEWTFLFLVYPCQWSCLKALGLYTFLQWYQAVSRALFGPLKDITWFKTQRRKIHLETLASFGSFTCFRKLCCLLYVV